MVNKTELEVERCRYCGCEWICPECCGRGGEPTTRAMLAMSTAQFDEHDRLEAARYEREAASVVHAGEALGEHWRHQSVLWAQGLLERYPDIFQHVAVGPFGLGKYRVWHHKRGESSFHETAREAAEAIIPPANEGEA